MLSTKSKILVARALSKPIIAIRSLFGLSTTVVTTRRGLTWSLDLKEGIDLAIYLLGGFEVQTLRQYEKLVKEGDVVLDIGANIGAHTIPLAKLVGASGKVFAFEPEPLNFANLHKNVFENRLQKIVSCFPIALSNSNSLRSFYLKTISPGDALHSIDYPSPQLDTRNLQDISSQEILTFSLDSLISIFKLPIPTHCKIDVDGAEMSVLEGMKETLMYAEKLSLYIELDLDDASGNFIGVCEYLKKMGFDLLEVGTAETFHSPNVHNCLFKKS